MYLLKKVIQFRENSHPDHEKPFLEHLEDLRIMVTRIVLTLLVSVIVCFTFQKQLMDILRRPVDQVWITQMAEKLPGKGSEAARPVDVDTWEAAKTLEQATRGLDPAESELLFRSHGDENLVFHARSVRLLRAVLALPEEKRDGFLNELEISGELRKQVKSLVTTSPSPESDSRGNLRLMSALRPTETFMLSMKLSFFAGIVLAFPLLLMFVLQFVLPGMHHNEKRVMWPAMAVGFGLFLCGVCFAYFVVLPRALMFFYEWSGSLGVSNDWRIGEYISFATQFTLLFGLSFELPVVVMVFVKLGMLNYQIMSSSRGYAVLAIFVTAAVLTPTPDALTLSLMALPMIVLYEVCIWLAWFDYRKNRVSEEKEAREREERLLAGYSDTNPDYGHTSHEDSPPVEGDDSYTDSHGGAEHDEYPQNDPHDERFTYPDLHEGADDGWTGEDPYEDYRNPPELRESPTRDDAPEPSDQPDQSDDPESGEKPAP